MKFGLILIFVFLTVSAVWGDDVKVQPQNSDSKILFSCDGLVGFVLFDAKGLPHTSGQIGYIYTAASVVCNLRPNEVGTTKPFNCIGYWFYSRERVEISFQPDDEADTFTGHFTASSVYNNEEVNDLQCAWKD